MIRQMISLDPKSRKTFQLILAAARDHILPECFYTFLHEYMSSIGERPSVLLRPCPPPQPHIPATSLPGVSPVGIAKAGKEALSGPAGAGEVLPVDSDYRITRIWEDYANIEVFLDESAAERTVMDVRVEYGAPLSVASSSHQVEAFCLTYFFVDKRNRTYFQCLCTSLPTSHHLGLSRQRMVQP